jgi:hypothetical protein
MQDFHDLCQRYIFENVKSGELKDALTAYIDYVIERTK